MTDTNTLYLVDGSGFIFRAYFAIQAYMTSQEGQRTNAVFGFTRILLNLIRDRAPRHVAVVFDAPGPSFREAMYPPYKANRTERPEDLGPQFDLCREATRALGIPLIELTEYEADDLMGTLASRWTATGRPCVLVTADKDMMQLVDDLTTIWDGREKFTERAGVIEKFGVPPERVVDVLGLAGDSSDNIPGVPGIGVKTAAKLLAEHGDLEALLEAASAIKGKRGENLRQFADQARLSAELATIRRDAPIETTPESLVRSPADEETLAAFFARMNFRQFQKEMGLATRTEVRVDHSQYRTVTDEYALAEVAAAARYAEHVSVQLLTTGPDPHGDTLTGIAVAWAPGQAFYVPFAHEHPSTGEQLLAEAAFEVLGPILTAADTRIVGHDLKAALKFLAAHGVEPAEIAGDVQLAAFVLEPGLGAYALDPTSQEVLGHALLTEKAVAEDTATGSSRSPVYHLEKATPAAVTPFVCERADVALRIAAQYARRIHAEPALEKVYTEIELPLTRILARMERTGIRVDPYRLREQSQRFAQRLAELQDEIHTLAGGPFKIRSTKELGQVLFEDLELPVGKKTKTGYSTDKHVLEGLRALHPLPSLVLEWRERDKLKSTYLDALPTQINPRTGRVHTTFRQHGAATGRLSSADPNLQNIPVRKEVAHISGDETMLQGFRDGVDVHTRTASEVFGVPMAEVTPLMRSQAKAVNYGIGYGAGAWRLSTDLQISREEAESIIDRYKARYPQVAAYVDDRITEARETGQVTTLFGRARKLPDIHSRRYNLRSASERMAINTPIQGTAADLLKLAMVRLDTRLRQESMRTRMLLTVHDELVLEVPEPEIDEATAIVREEMVGVGDLQSLRAPLEVDIGVGADWASIH
jgi:DNA polymerase-1